MDRRRMLQQITRGALALTLLPLSALATAAAATLHKSKAEWRALLPGRAYFVLIEEATERARSSPLDKEKRAGTYLCAACYAPLFASSKKYDSRTGWPSFFEALPAAVNTKKDGRTFVPRTEYHCARCGGHQGHLFNDGPMPSGRRYCNNGIALRFVAAGNPLPPLRT